jgi:hypothetical protein
MKMEMVFVIFHVMVGMANGILKIRVDPDKGKAKVISTETKTMPHPISNKKDSAIEKKTHGTGNLQG